MAGIIRQIRAILTRIFGQAIRIGAHKTPHHFHPVTRRMVSGRTRGGGGLIRGGWGVAPNRVTRVAFTTRTGLVAHAGRDIGGRSGDLGGRGGVQGVHLIDARLIVEFAHGLLGENGAGHAIPRPQPDKPHPPRAQSREGHGQVGVEPK